jgi:adenosyl cobinamide kinase/adenosyl cobinamide phosphate guanylyltransferase
MTIYLVSGPPGAGKTAYTTKKIFESLRARRPVATNVVLADDFAEQISAHTVSRFRPELRADRADEYRRSVYHLDDVRDLFRIRVPEPENVEGRWTVVIDEAGTFLNAHLFKSELAAQFTEWFAQHRKLGADVFLIAQDVEMIVKQIRLLVGEHIELRNTWKFKKWGIPVMRLVSPFKPVFVAHTYWSGAGSKPLAINTEVYKLGWWRSLYSTSQIVAGPYAEIRDDSIVLPREPVYPVAELDRPELYDVLPEDDELAELAPTE